MLPLWALYWARYAFLLLLLAAVLALVLFHLTRDRYK